MPGKQLDLAHLLVHRHETLVEEPTEPFEFALAADLVKRRDLGLDLVDRSGQVVKRYGPNVEPKALESAIEALI